MHNNINHNRIYYKKFAGYWDRYKLMRESGGDIRGSLLGAMLYDTKGRPRGDISREYIKYINNVAPIARRGESINDAVARVKTQNAADWALRAQQWTNNGVPSWIARTGAGFLQYGTDLTNDMLSLGVLKSKDDTWGGYLWDKTKGVASVAANIAPIGKGITSVGVGAKTVGNQAAKATAKNAPGWGGKIWNGIKNQFRMETPVVHWDAGANALGANSDTAALYQETPQEIANRYKDKRVNHVRTPDRDYSRARNAE